MVRTPIRDTGGSAICLSATDARTELLSMMLTRCSQPTEESIRERPETCQSRAMSKERRAKLAYSLFPIRVSIFRQLRHSKESSSWPGLSASMPNSNIAVPHFEQAGRLIELECAVAGWYLSPGRMCQRKGQRWAILAQNIQLFSLELLFIPN